MSNAPGWATLADDESVLWLGRPVIYHFLDGIVGGVLLAGVAVAVFLFWPGGVGGVPRFVPAAAAGGLAVLVTLWPLVQRWSVTYLVTTHQVYVKRGLVTRNVKNLHVEQIQNTSFNESLFGRLLSYGNVSIDTAGSEGPEVILRNVADPDEVLGLIAQHTER